MSKDSESGPYKSGQWAPQPREQYPPPPQQSSYPAPSPYNQPPHPHSQQQQQQPPPPPPPPQGPPSAQPGEMLTLPPPQSHMPQDPYRGHAQYDMYQQGQPGQMQYPPNHHPNHQPGGPVNFAQPAPRQRTAIACRYCRRRKIRCHGFDLSPDGRCTNCARFHQECIFTPVSSQAHAFVPAHTAYPHLRNPGRVQQTPDGRPIYPQGQPVIYGAHGQPLGPMGQQGHDSSYPPPMPQQQQQYGPGPYPGYDERGPPPHPQDQHSRAGPPARRSSGAAYEYPDPTHMAPVSPASSTTSYQSAPYPPQGQQPYYPSQQQQQHHQQHQQQQQPPARRPSPPAGYPGYENRASSSPHGSTSSATTFSAHPSGLHPPQVLPPTYESGRTPPPSQGRDSSSSTTTTTTTTTATTATTNGSRPGMSVRDMLSPGDNQGARSSADSDMLKALNRRVM